MKQLLKQKKNYLLGFWILGIVVYLSVRNNSWIAENIFACGIFRLYSNVLSFITGLLPFSLGEFIVMGIPVFIVVRLITYVIRLVRHEQKLVYTMTCIRNVLILSGVIFFWFMISCGANYYRYEFTYYSNLEIRKSTPDELYELCSELTERTNNARRMTGIPSDETFHSGYSNRERAEKAAEAMNKLSDTYNILNGYFPCPKSVLFSRFMSEFNITGVFFPFTMESNVNVDIPEHSRGVTLCHELVHLRGFMREDEANYISYLACCNSGDAELNYSGLLLALIISGNALYAESSDLYYSVSSQYSEGVLRDLRASSLYWEQFEDTALSEIGEAVNDAYLKANNQTDGTKSYGRMVDLLLAERRAQKKASE